MSQELVLVVIGLVVAVIVFSPLMRGRTKPEAGVTVKDHGPAAASADELSELELDHEMGRVSDADYERWRGEIAVPSEPVPDARNDAVTDATSRAEALVRQFRDRPPAHCPKCGDRPEADARFCSNCGTTLG
jgi:cytochrome c-type biogenesis protein CcmH/NrfG